MNTTAETIEAKQLSDLIGAVYDCVLDPGRWDATLEEIRRFLDCANCLLNVVDLCTKEIRTQKFVGIEPDLVAKMAEYGDELTRLYESTPDYLTRSINEPFSPSRDVKDQANFPHRFYREWARPQGLVDSIGVLLMRRPDRLAEIGLGRHERAGLVTEREVRRLRLLAPHLRRAVVISDLIDMKVLESESFAGVMDHVSAGVILVSADGLILHANRVAERMLESKSPIASTSGRLCTVNSGTNDRLRQAIESVAKEDAIGTSGVGLALYGSADEPATAHVLSLARGDARPELMPGAVAAVFVASGLRLPVEGLEAVAEAFSLTPAETRLLEHIARGKSVAQAAKALNIALSTARTHLRRLLAKTGTHSQTSLLALIHTLVPAVGGDKRGRDSES